MSNHSQTLEMLANRGGLGPSEILAIVDDRKWRSMPLNEAWDEMLRRHDEWRTSKDTHKDNDSDEAVKVREALRRFCDRYAYQTRHGSELGADLVLDELVLFVRMISSEKRL